MSANLVDFGSRFLVWIMALFAALDAIGAILVALMKREMVEASIWFFVGFSMFGLAALVERVKVVRGGF